MKRRLSFALISAAALILAPVTPSAAATASDTSLPDGETGVFYKVTLAEPATTDDLLASAQAYDLSIQSVRHGGTTNGELIVGSTPLADALDMYRETNIGNFGTPPQIESFITDQAPPSDLHVGATAPSSVQAQALSSTDPTPTEDDTTAANIEDPWAPRKGSLWAHNSNTGAPRQIRHKMYWSSRAGLNSYETSDDEFVYEHDNKLFDRDPYGVGAMGHKACMPDYWLSGDTWIVTSNVPDSSTVYADNANASDPCGVHDISFGIFDPENLQTNHTYKIVVGGNAGNAPRSPFGLLGQKMVRSCGLDSPWCVSLGSDPRERSDIYINESRNWKVPGCYTWYTSDDKSPVRGIC